MESKEPQQQKQKQQQPAKRTCSDLLFCPRDTCSCPYDVIVGHYPCNDGVCAMWAIIECYILRPTSKGIDPCKGHRVLPTEAAKPVDARLLNNKSVVLVDTSFSKAFIDTLSVQVLLILDHHETAERELLPHIETGAFLKNIAVEIDKTRSGAQIAWDSSIDPGKGTRRPLLLDMVGDTDLYRFTIPNSAQVISFLSATGAFRVTDFHDIRVWQRLSALMEASADSDVVKEWTAGGATLQRVSSFKRDVAMESAELRYVCTPKTKKWYRVYLVECEQEAVNKTGHALATREECDFAAVWRFDAKENMFRVSCRADRSEVNLSVICAEFEFRGEHGGGHAGAAGFFMSAANDGSKEGNALDRIFRKEKIEPGVETPWGAQLWVQ